MHSTTNRSSGVRYSCWGKTSFISLQILNNWNFCFQCIFVKASISRFSRSLLTHHGIIS